MLFASFALSPSLGGSTQTAAGVDRVAQSPPSPPLLPAAPASAETQCDAERDAWAASIYQQLAASCLLSPSLDTRLPTVPVILHPSAPRGAAAQPVTARHIGFLRVDLTGESAGPGRFFPLLPADAAEEEQGVDTGSLDRFGCTGHWASSGCIRLLTAAAVATQPGISGCSSGLALLPPEAFAALWARCEAADGSSSSAPCDWHVPYSRLLPLEEAYGGLYRELKAGGYDLSRCHYMLRGWKTREGRPRLGASAPRSSTTTGVGQRARRHRGVVPAALAATRDLRAMVNWPGLLELLEEEGVEAVPTDGMRYWLARLAAGFQAQLAAAGVLCAETSVHHIIARSARGIDHPLNYFLIDRGPNSAMGSKVEGFRDADGNKLHMRDVVGERAFEVAHAACCLYHGVLYAGRRRGAPPAQTLRELREGATALAEEALQARRATAARQQARRGGDAAAGVQQLSQQEPGLADEPASSQQQRSSLKRERCAGQQAEVSGGGAAPALSPSQQQQDRRRRLSGEAHPSPHAQAAAAEEAGELAGDGTEAVLAALSLQCNPEVCSLPLAAEGPPSALLQGKDRLERQANQRGSIGGPPAGLSSLRGRLQEALSRAAAA